MIFDLNNFIPEIPGSLIQDNFNIHIFETLLILNRIPKNTTNYAFAALFQNRTFFVVVVTVEKSHNVILNDAGGVTVLDRV